METILGAARGQQALPLGDPTGVAAARRASAHFARQVGCTEVRAGKLALVVTEAATNIVRHAGEGEVLIQSVSCGDKLGVEVMALDRGPGMPDLERSMQDGTSTAGTYGVGLGAMQRNADEFDAWTFPGKGTVVRMVVWSQDDIPSTPRIEMGAVCVPMPGETMCGDTWMAGLDDEQAMFVVCDGLGHGPDAAFAACEATRVAAQAYLPADQLLQRMHQALRATRGAAVAVAELDLAGRQVRFAGVGNIAASVISNGRRHQLVSHNGIVGGNVSKIQVFPAAWEPHAVLVAHSDGLSSRWSLDDYPGLHARHPAVIAAVLYRDFARRRDDMTVLVVRQGGAC